MAQAVICPECGHMAVHSAEFRIQEIDAEEMKFYPPESLTELRCDDCGWLASVATRSH